MKPIILVDIRSTFTEITVLKLNKNKEIYAILIYSTVGQFAEQAKL